MSNGKKKGAKNERNLCKWFQDWSGYEFARVPASGGLRWSRTDNVTGDIICSDDRYSRRFAFSVETKFHKDINFEHLILGNSKVKVLEFWEQATNDAQRANRTALLFMRYNNMPSNTWLVIMGLKEFNILLRQNPTITEDTYFLIEHERKHRLALLNSNTLLKTDFKKLSIELKKLKRKNGK